MHLAVQFAFHNARAGFGVVAGAVGTCGTCVRPDRGSIE
jgi:hypothetical protein